ncbi:polysaccharide deacetylase family protein [Bhargavaea ullalensis]|uniref:Peptidoglycan/xylan/chitin deacetylase (PgdA/CDA1 family) n=1 Tax=Bhargavaea ullalensis TaxID=1265685 RepID=A0ABV2GC02_9BACL
MRKTTWLMYIAVAALLLLGACGNGSKDNNSAATGEGETVPAGGQPEEDQSGGEETGGAGEGDKETAEETEEEAELPAEPLYELNEATWSFQPVGDANPQAALLTFDDAPDKHALEIAKTLIEKDAPAIFFVNGHFLDSDSGKEMLKEIHDMGFPIGNHTMTHANLKELSEDQQREEILGVNEIVESVIGEKPRFFRAPFGSNTDFSRQLVSDEGMLLMNWTYGYDWEKQYMDADALADIMVNSEYLNNGANLLMHDREWTSAALPRIIDGLRGKGYELIDPATIKLPEN